MSKLDYYIHDEADALRLQIEGDLAGPDVVSLEQAWKTAKSVLDGRKLVIDLVSACEADEYGRDLLVGWYRVGARMVARSSESRAFVEGIVGAPVPMRAAKPGWRQRLSNFLLRRSASAAGKPARATKTSTALLAAKGGGDDSLR